MGFAGYFLIVADFIKWAKANDIPVGPGRGSGAGSVVAWALTITDLDPIALDLLFERFLNPERVSMPDFDIDFCETHRDKVIAYVQQKYGRDRVAQIITFGRLKARAVLKDTGRVLQMSYGQVDRLAKLIPNHPTDPWTLERALNGVIRARRANIDDDADVKRLFDLAMKLEGLPRHASTHAAGVVIGDRPLDELVPLYRDPRSDMPVTQFDMKYVEARGAGEVRLPRAQDPVGAQGRRSGCSPSAASRSISPRCRGTIRRSMSCSSAATRSACSSWNPKACGGRWRRCADQLRRHHRARLALPARARWTTSRCSATARTAASPIAYPHPMLEGILDETYGIFVYQEQVMQAAQVLAGYSLGEADLLRRAMGKKIQSEMDAQRAALRRGLRAAQRHRRGQGQRAVRLDRQVRRLRLQQEPRRGLRAGRLPDRLAEGASPAPNSSPRR